MVYDRIPGVDSAGNFPPEVRNAFLNSPEIGDVRSTLENHNRRLEDYFGRESTNLFDATKVTSGVVLPAGSATPTENLHYVVSDPIPVTESSYIYANALRATFLDANGAYVAHVDRAAAEYRLLEITNPATTQMRLSVRVQDLDIAQLNVGSTLLPYEPGGLGQIPAERLDLSAVQPAGDYIEGKVKPEDTSFFDYSTNLLDLSKVTDGYVYPAGSGELSVNAQHGVSDWIPVTPGAAYTYNEFARVTFFDAQREYVSFMGSSFVTHHTFDTPVGAVWARLTVTKVKYNEAQMNAGSTLLPYEPAKESLIPARYLDLPDVPDALEDRLVHPTNLINTATATFGWRIPAGTGTPAEDENHYLSAPIPIVAGETYTSYRPIRVTFFRGETFVSYLTLVTGEEQTWVAPEGADNVRATFNKGYYREGFFDSVQINAGDTLLPYEPWHPPYIKEDSLPKEPWFPLHPEDPFIVDTAGLDEVFISPAIDAYPGLDTVPATEVYGWWDDLVDAHPNYITRRDLGKSSDGITPLYAYVLKPEEVSSHTDGSVIENLIKPLPVAFLMSGTHGYEETGVHSLWRLAKDLCEEWHTSPVLDALRWNIEIIAVPLVNPAGWDGGNTGGKRKNANGVDLARNFSTLWSESDPTSATYGGPSALSEPETQAIDALMQEVAHRCVFGSSFHNFSAAAERPWMIWNAAGNQMMLNLGKKLVSRISRKWKQERDWITEPGPYYGYSDLGAPPGSEGMALVGHGIPGSTFETSQWCYLDGTPGEKYDSRVLTLGYEAVVNYVAMGVSEGLKAKPAPQS